jgi:glutathione synthase/RimK-type ligase-like ATP-grasp enzyme
MGVTIAIHTRAGGYSDRWIEYCKKQAVSYLEVNGHNSSIMAQLRSVDALMWNWVLDQPQDLVCARRAIQSAESMGLKVFPNTATCWHYDDKLAQKYLLEAAGAPLVPTHVFYDLPEAEAWIRETEFPKVFKLSRGAGSLNVKLVRSAAEAMRLARRAFADGFKPAAAYWQDARAKAARHRRQGNVLSAIRRLPRTLSHIRRFNQAMTREKGYLYLQDFVPGNRNDTRITVIGNRAFGFTRDVRADDFRASGSGSIDYDLAAIDLRSVKIAFDVAAKLRTQSLAFDFVRATDGEPKIVEISYCFLASAVHDCRGHWDANLKWHDGPVWPEDAIIEDLLNELRSGRS